MPDAVTAATPMSYLASGPAAGRHCFRQLPGQRRRLHGRDLCGSAAGGRRISGGEQGDLSPRFPVALHRHRCRARACCSPWATTGWYWLGYQVLSGGLMLGAIFMATDYATSPVTKGGQIVYGIGCGLHHRVHPLFRLLCRGRQLCHPDYEHCVYCCMDKIGVPKRFGYGEAPGRRLRNEQSKKAAAPATT